jgi:hypothetical protein
MKKYKDLVKYGTLFCIGEDNYLMIDSDIAYSFSDGKSVSIDDDTIIKVLLNNDEMIQLFKGFI